MIVRLGSRQGIGMAAPSLAVKIKASTEGKAERKKRKTPVCDLGLLPV